MKRIRKISLLIISALLLNGCYAKNDNNSTLSGSITTATKSEDNNYEKYYYLDNYQTNEEYEEEFDIENVKMYSVDSSCFSYVGYDPEFEVLVLVFRETPNRCYEYDYYPYDEYKDFINSDSLGSYYHSYIKSTYDYSYRYDNIKVKGGYISLN